MTTANVVRASVMYPALRTSILIRWQAIRLWVARTEGAASMSVIDHQPAWPSIDLERWPALAPPKSARTAGQCWLRCFCDEWPLEPAFELCCQMGVASVRKMAQLWWCMTQHAFFARLGRDGKIGFGESYMAE